MANVDHVLAVVAVSDIAARFWPGRAEATSRAGALFGFLGRFNVPQSARLRR